MAEKDQEVAEANDLDEKHTEAKEETKKVELDRKVNTSKSPSHKKGKLKQDEAPPTK